MNTTELMKHAVFELKKKSCMGICINYIESEQITRFILNLQNSLGKEVKPVEYSNQHTGFVLQYIDHVNDLRVLKKILLDIEMAYGSNNLNQKYVIVGRNISNPQIAIIRKQFKILSLDS